MGRKKKAEEGAAVPVCAQGHNLERRVADAPYECDKCSGDIALSSCFFGCEPCDYSICGTCYVQAATEAAEKAENESKYAHLMVRDGEIHKDVWDLCETFSIEDKVMFALNEEMKKRHATWQEDFAKLWMEMKNAKFPGAGLLFTKVKEMRAGTFVGKKPPAPEVLRVLKRFNLDGDAKEKLCDFLQKRQENEQWKKDIWEIEQRLIGHRNPFMMCLTMIVKLQQGHELPPIKEDMKRKGLQEEKDKEREKERGSRSRSRERDRDRGGRGRSDRDRSRSRGRGRSDRGSEAGRGGRSDDRGGSDGYDQSQSSQGWHGGNSNSYDDHRGGSGSKTSDYNDWNSSSWGQSNWNQSSW